MNKCDTTITKEFKRIENKVKYTAIPVFTLLIALAILIDFDTKILITGIISVCTAVTLIWICTRNIIVRFRKLFSSGEDVTKRLILQIILTVIIALIITIFTIYIDHSICKDGTRFGEWWYKIKKISILAIIYTFFLNALYEGIFMFQKFTEKAFEAEEHKKASIEANLRNLTNSINPHFLFNTLNTLSIIIEEDQNKAIQFVQELSDVYRYVLNSQNSNWVTLEQEIQFADSYINLLKMRFENDLIIEKKITNICSNCFVIPLVIQILIENAVKHNEISHNNNLYITVFANEDYLIVKNNKQKRISRSDSNGFGLTNIKNRYKFLTKKDIIIYDEEKTFEVKVPLIKSVES